MAIDKDKPLKVMLRETSLKYFSPNPDNVDWVSDFELDLCSLPPRDRAEMHIKILKYHTPQMQATSVDIASSDINVTLSERLARLADEEADDNT